MLRKIKEQVPKNFLIGVRISPEIEDIGISIDESIKLVKILKNEGVDFIHLSCWDVFKNSSMYPKSSKTLTELFFDSINDLPPIISTGGVWSSKDARELLKQGPNLLVLVALVLLIQIGLVKYQIKIILKNTIFF